MTKKVPTLVGLFAGIGGIESGFERAGFRTISANEIDPYAVKTYRENYAHPVIEADISDIGAVDLLSGSRADQVTILAGGFPCQPFSVAGYRKGFDDERGNVFWQIHRLILELQPEVVFLENVKNLENHDKGQTFATIKGALEGINASPTGQVISPGYTVLSKVLNAKDFGVPQNRERIFIVAFRNQAAASKFEFPLIDADLNARPSLAQFINFEEKVDPKYYYNEERPFFTQLKDAVTSEGVIYQWRRQYVRENKSGLCPTLTANMGMGGHNVPIIFTKFGIRKLTPSECFKLMGFGDLKQPPGMADSRLYKQAGNAVVVPVIEAIAKQIKLALN
jgi:DNA (cytosine-5)-methyltransferase 1